MGADLEQRTRAEVVDAYGSVTRLRVYMRLALLTSILFFVANLGGMIVGWLPVDVGVLRRQSVRCTASTRRPAGRTTQRVGRLARLRA